jgi:hypothetical protein
VARAAAQPKYAPPRETRSRVPFSSAGRRASDGLSPLRAEGPREKVALCAKNGCKAQAKATQRTTWARQGYAALQQAVSGSCSAHRRRSVTGPLRERKQQCTRNTEKAVVKKRRGDQAPPANQERAKKLGMNSNFMISFGGIFVFVGIYVWAFTFGYFLFLGITDGAFIFGHFYIWSFTVGHLRLGIYGWAF